MSDIGQWSTTSTTYSMTPGPNPVHDVSVVHVVPQLSLVLGEAIDKDSTASAFSFMRGRGIPRRVVYADFKLLFLCCVAALRR